MYFKNFNKKTTAKIRFDKKLTIFLTRYLQKYTKHNMLIMLAFSIINFIIIFGVDAAFEIVNINSS